MKTILSLLTPKQATYFLEDDVTIRQALEKFDAHKFSVVPLLDKEGHYKGTLSEGDLLRFIKNKVNFDIQMAEHTSIKDVEHYRSYKALHIDTSILEIFALALDQNFVPLVDDLDHYIGIIKRKEVIKYLSENNLLKQKI